MSGRELEWAALMRKAMAGDEQAYQRLLAGLVPALRAVTRRSLLQCGQSPDETEDIVQDVLIAVHLKRHTWKSEAPFSPWLYAIARNKLIDTLRRKGRRVFVPVDDFENVLADESAPVAGEGPREVSEIEPHLPQLPKGQRDVVRAIALEHKSIRQTADALSMSEGAVRVALHRGVAALAAIVRKADAEAGEP